MADTTIDTPEFKKDVLQGLKTPNTALSGLGSFFGYNTRSYQPVTEEMSSPIQALKQAFADMDSSKITSTERSGRSVSTVKAYSPEKKAVFDRLLDDALTDPLAREELKQIAGVEDKKSQETLRADAIFATIASAQNLPPELETLKSIRAAYDTASPNNQAQTRRNFDQQLIMVQSANPTIKPQLDALISRDAAPVKPAPAAAAAASASATYAPNAGAGRGNINPPAAVPATPEAQKPPAVKPAEQKPDPKRSSSYNVEKGDTLSMIAYKWAQQNPDQIGKDKTFHSWRDVEKQMHKDNDLHDIHGKRCDGVKIIDARIVTGQVLKVPEGVAIEGVRKVEDNCAPAIAPKKTAAPKPKPSPAPAAVTQPDPPPVVTQAPPPPAEVQPPAQQTIIIQQPPVERTYTYERPRMFYPEPREYYYQPRMPSFSLDFNFGGRNFGHDNWRGGHNNWRGGHHDWRGGDRPPRGGCNTGACGRPPVGPAPGQDSGARFKQSSLQLNNPEFAELRNTIGAPVTVAANDAPANTPSGSGQPRERSYLA